MRRVGRSSAALLLGVSVVGALASAVWAASLTIQPSDQDAYIMRAQPNAVHGSAITATRMFVQPSTGTTQNPRYERALVQFDLPIPRFSTITSATLEINEQSGNLTGPRTHGAHRITSSWLQSTVKWNTMPTFNPTATDTATVGTSRGFKTFNVTADVQDMVNDPTTNHGWMVIDENETNANNAEVGYVTREETQASQIPNKPILQVNYTPPSCSQDSDCADNNACTVNERCVAGFCQVDQLNCDDGNPCTDDICDPQQGCEHVSGICSDGFSCTQDICDPNTGACSYVFDNTVCLHGGCQTGTCVADQSNNSIDPVTGCQVQSVAPDGTACNADNNACTQDTCAGGNCQVGSPVTCPPGDQCHNQGTCDPNTGQCSTPNKPNGTPCNDGNACTTSDQCTGGSCGGTPVTCTPLDQCHQAGTCDPNTGLCSNPTQPNGTPCNDGNACTTGDQCTGGSCGGAFITCTPLDQCHQAGTCDPNTGLCSNPTQPNGTPCNDGNACTTGDHCTGGACGGTAVTCTPLDQCHQAGTCDSNTGQCSNPLQPDNTPCNDGNVCTINDKCTNGTCSGSLMTCGDGIVEASCGEQCDPPGGDCDATCHFICGPTPRTDCLLPTAAGKTRLQIKNTTPDTKDLISWKWVFGQTVTLAQLGTPTSTTNYTLCVWDQSASGQPILRAQIPAGGTCGTRPCWSSNKTGDKYKNKLLTPDGIQLLVLKAASAPKAKVILKGKGPVLHTPTLPLTPRVTVQLKNDLGTCWSAPFSTFVQDTPTQYKAKGD